MKGIHAILVLLLTLFVAVPEASTQPGGRWLMLGTANVDGGIDHDNIQVGRSQGPMRALQLRVRGSAINFQRVVAHFENGQDQELQLRSVIRAGASTRPLNLQGGRRNLRSVEFWYARANWGSRPGVVLYGMR